MKLTSIPSYFVIAVSTICAIALLFIGVTQLYADKEAEKLTQRLSRALDLFKNNNTSTNNDKMRSFFSNPPERDQCLMSWMHPNYIQLRVPKLKDKVKDKYHLYLYREKSDEFAVNGIPVLFIHGHGGLYKQARSLGPAVDKRRQADSPFPDSFNHLLSKLHTIQASNETTGYVPLDIFTVDFLEEFSSFHSQLLWDQASYVNHCIKFIMSMYNTGQKSVIIVAHSMGGLVARAVPLLKSYTEGSIDTMITLSTPHREHPLFVDSSLYSFYNTINTEWITRKDKFKDMAVISIGNGFRDTMIRSDATNLQGIIGEENSFSVSSYSVQNVRISPDHLSITWCRQVMNTIGNALLELVNSKENTKMGLFDAPLKDRMNILKKHFLESPAYRNLLHVHDTIEYFPLVPKNRILANRNSLTISELNSSFKPLSNIIYVFDAKKARQTKRDSLSILSNFPQDQFSIYGSNGDEPDRYFRLNNMIESLPFVKVGQKQEQEESINQVAQSIFRLNARTLSKFDEIVISVHQIQSENSQLTVDFYSEKKSQQLATFPGFAQLLTQPVTILTNQKHEGVVHIKMNKFPRQYAYRMKVKECSSKHMHPIAYVYYTDKYPTFEDRYYVDARDFKIKFFYSNSASNGFTTTLLMNPSCPLTVMVDIDIPETLSQVFRFNHSPILATMIAIMLLACSHQISTGFKIGITRSIYSILFSRIIPILCTLLPLITTYIPVSQIPQLLINSKIFSSHTPSLHQDDCWYILIVGLFAYAVVVLLAFTLHLLTLVLALPMKLVFGLPNYFRRLTGGVWFIVMNSLGLIALFCIHSGVAFGLGVILMIGNLSFRKFARNKQQTYVFTNNSRSGALLFCAVASILIGCPTIVYLREWQLRVESNFNPRNEDALTHISQISYLAKLFASQMPDRYFVDSTKLLLLPLIQYFSYYFTHSIYETKQGTGMIELIVRVVLESSAYFVLIASRFRGYLSIYALAVSSIALFAYGFSRSTETKRNNIKQKTD